MFGLSDHAGKRKCLWCEGLKNEFGTLVSFHNNWHEIYEVQINYTKSTQTCTSVYKVLQNGKKFSFGQTFKS